MSNSDNKTMNDLTPDVVSEIMDKINQPEHGAVKENVERLVRDVLEDPKSRELVARGFTVGFSPEVDQVIEEGTHKFGIAVLPDTGEVRVCVGANTAFLPFEYPGDPYAVGLHAGVIAGKTDAYGSFVGMLTTNNDRTPRACQVMFGSEFAGRGVVVCIYIPDGNVSGAVYLLDGDDKAETNTKTLYRVEFHDPVSTLQADLADLKVSPPPDLIPIEEEEDDDDDEEERKEPPVNTSIPIPVSIKQD